jgi:hypothetical protein
MKKNGVLLGVLILVCAAFASAQNLDAAVQKAVDDLSARMNRPIAVSISPVTIADSDTPTAFSRYLWDKINQYAVNNTKYRVVQATRGISAARTDEVQNGTITGTYHKTGNTVEVTLFLSADTNNQRLASAAFTISAAELERLGLAILPENAKTEKEVKEREEIFAPLDVPVQNTAFSIKAWPNSNTRTYNDGDTLTITLFASRDCYFKAYHIDVNGKMQMIFPNPDDRNNFLRANTEMTIPSGSAFKLGAPYGQETIMVVAAPTQFENLEAEMVMVVNASRDAVSRSMGSRGLTVVNRPPNPANDATATTRFTFTILSPARR